MPETDGIIGYGFYSRKAEELYGGVYEYLTPTGESVHVTAIELDPAGKEYQWGDKVAVGPVVKWVRTVVMSRRKNYYL